VCQQVVVPEGATRFFLGTMDGFGWFNNEGQFDVQVTDLCGTTAVPDDENNSAGSLSFRLHGPSPNPFRFSTNISWELATGMRASIRIYDMRGRVVTTLFDQWSNPGRSLVTWSARDDFGRVLSPGVYFIRLQVGASSKATKVIYER
jgi:hypothetical protein